MKVLKSLVMALVCTLIILGLFFTIIHLTWFFMSVVTVGMGFSPLAAGGILAGVLTFIILFIAFLIGSFETDE